MKWTIDETTGDIMSEQSRIARVYGATEYNQEANAEECMKTARLIATAPELYEMLKEELIPASDYGGLLSLSREARVRKLLARIDGGENL